MNIPCGNLKIENLSLKKKKNRGSYYYSEPLKVMRVD